MRIALIASSQFAIPLLDHYSGPHEICLINTHPVSSENMKERTEELINFCDFGDHIKVRTHDHGKRVRNQRFDIMIGSEQQHCPVRSKLRLNEISDSVDYQKKEQQSEDYKSQKVISFGRIILFANIDSSDCRSLTGDFERDLQQIKQILDKNLRQHQEDQNQGDLNSLWNKQISFFSAERKYFSYPAISG